MIIRHGGHIFGSIHKVRKGLWTLDCAIRDADWLGRQSPITWITQCPTCAQLTSSLLT